MSNIIVIAPVLLMMNLLCWSSTPPAVRVCVIGEGSGFTCGSVMNDCYWSFQRPGHTVVIGPHLNLNQDSEIGEYFCRNRITNEVEDIVFVMPIGNKFTCAHCVGMTTCHNGNQAEFHLTVNIHHQIIDRNRCSLFRNGYEFICGIGTSQCLVDSIDPSDQYFVKCPIHGYTVNMMSATENVNTTLPGCTVFSQKAAGPNSTCQGSDATFRCQVVVANHTATPAVWRQNRQLVGFTVKHTTVFNTTDGITYLVVHNVSVEDDNGSQYICSDAEGRISSSVTLNVTGPPSSSDVTITNQCLTHLTVSWTGNFDDLTTCGPVLYNVTVSHHDRVIQSVTVNNTSSTLTGLVPATNYTITVHSINNAGYSASSTTATTAGRITNLKGIVYDVTSVSISWANVVTTSFICEEEKHLYYIVSLSYPNGTHLEINTTLNHITFKNLTKDTTYVVTVTAATTTTGAASSSQITLTTTTQAQKGDESSAIPIAVAAAVISVIFIIIIFVILVIAISWCKGHRYNTIPLPNSDSDPSIHQPEQITVTATVSSHRYSALLEYDGAASPVICQPTNRTNEAEGHRNLYPCYSKELMDTIRRAHVEIKRHIKFPTLLGYLNKYAIFTTTEASHFTSDSHEVSVNNLIEWLAAKSDDGIFNFVKALNDEKEHSGHKQILQAIKVIVCDDNVFMYD